MAQKPTAKAAVPVQTIKVEATTEADEAAKKKAEAEAAAEEKAEMVAKKGELATAVHLLVITNDEGRPEEIQPGVTFYPPLVDEAFLHRAGAIREPTEAEFAMFERTNPPKPAESAADVLG